MESTTSPAALVFLLDVDNTLLDNDGVVADMRTVLTAEVGSECERRYWAIFEEQRAEVGYADYLGTLQKYRLEHPRDSHLLTLSSFLLNYPFATRLFPRALEVVAWLGRWGQTVILTDGDIVFQPLKIERSGLLRAVDRRVLLYVHKEQELDDVAQRFPADHYVLIDDKITLLTAVKAIWGDRVTTVFPKQGHYAFDADVTRYPKPDVTIEHISDLLKADPPPGVSAKLAKVIADAADEDR